jgi:small-conductance mechanosensitive channel
VGVGLGFGLQKLAANYISGFVLLIERSIRIGDYVRVEHVEGRVIDIKTRFTLIQAINGSEAVVPNETMMTQLVENLSLQSANFQLSCVYTLSQDSPVEQVQTLLINAAKSVPEVLSEPAPSALLLEVSPLGLRFQVYFWIQDASKGQGLARSRVNIAVLAAFKAAGIELARAPQSMAWLAPHGAHQ